MPKEIMISGDWWKEVKKKSSPKYIEWNADKIEVEVDFPKELHSKLKTDPLLLQKLSDAGSVKYKAFIDSAAQQVKQTEGELEKISRAFDKHKDIIAFGKEWDAIQTDFVKELRSQAMAAETDIAKAILGAFKTYQATKKEYKAYKIRAGVKLGLKFGSLAFAIGKLIGTSGADLFAWRSLVRDSIKTISEITKLAVSAETFRKGTEKQLKVVLAWHARLKDGAGATASEVGLGLLKALVGTDCEMTLDAVGSNVKQYKSKLKGVELSAHSAAKKLQIALNRMDSVKAEVPADIQSQMTELENQVRELISEVSDLMGEVAAGVRWADTTEGLVKEMKIAKKVENLSKLVKLIETAFDGYSAGNGWPDAIKGLDTGAAKVTKTLITVGKNIDRWHDDVKKLATAK